jgi:predicted ATP-grasp superfamily ATP-dependent carboligase
MAHQHGLGNVVAALGTALTDRQVRLLSRYAREAVVYPDPRHDPDGFIDFLLARKNKWAGAVLIPTRDDEVEALSRHKRTLSEHFIVPVPEADAASLLLDKRKTYQLAEGLGIACPQTRYLGPGAGLPADLPGFPLPCLVKPVRSGRFWDLYRRKAFVAETHDQAIYYLNRAAADGVEVMVQELIPGPDELLHECVA